jgi:hypothetical protein
VLIVGLGVSDTVGVLLTEIPCVTLGVGDGVSEMDGVEVPLGVGLGVGLGVAVMLGVCVPEGV